MRFLQALFLLSFAACSSAQRIDAPVEPAKTPCTYCAEWNEPHAPFRIHGNSYYVGTNGLGAILVTSPEGHVLIDGALPESAPLIVANIEALGFRVEDVRLILNSHAHFDHAGGIAPLQGASGATVAASPASSRVLAAGRSGADDPQYGELLPFPAVEEVAVIADGDTLRVGPLALTAHFTPGHTAGGTTWSWRSCEGDECLDLVYADSLTPVSADGYFFSRSERYPSVLTDFAHSFAVLEQIACDILLTPHPAASNLWERLDAREGGLEHALIDTAACARYAGTARQRLAERLESER